MKFGSWTDHLKKSFELFKDINMYNLSSSIYSCNHILHEQHKNNHESNDNISITLVNNFGGFLVNNCAVYRTSFLQWVLRLQTYPIPWPKRSAIAVQLMMTVESIVSTLVESLILLTVWMLLHIMVVIRCKYIQVSVWSLTFHMTTCLFSLWHRCFAK